MSEGIKWEEILEESIDDLAKEVLYDLTVWEFERLAKRDPSFDDLAKTCRHLLSKVETLVHTTVTDNLKELVGILESIAQSIVDRDVKLLVDCTMHMQEFVEIRESNNGRS